MNINELFGVHADALSLRSRRLELLSKNLSNSDTPHFKAKDLDFREAMSRALDGQVRRMATTDMKHIAKDKTLSADIEKYRVPFNTAFDGNTVELAVEQAKFGKASADYMATLGFLESRVSSLRKSIRGE
jgi:flagellar basal-body rod protein FlgB